MEKPMTSKRIAVALIALSLPITVGAQPTAWTCTAVGAVVTCSTKTTDAATALTAATQSEKVLNVGRANFRDAAEESFQAMLKANGVKELAVIHGRSYADSHPYGEKTTTTETGVTETGATRSTTTTSK
jgi:hypothetical protein